MALLLVSLLMLVGRSAAQECKDVGKGCYDPCRGSGCFDPGTLNNGYACCTGTKCHVYSVSSQGSSGVCIPSSLTTGCLAVGQKCELNGSSLATPCCGASVCTMYDRGASGPVGRCAASAPSASSSPSPSPRPVHSAPAAPAPKEDASRVVPNPTVETTPSPEQQQQQQQQQAPSANATKSPAAAAAIKGPSAGVMVGAAFGAALLLAIVAGAAFLLVVRKRRQDQPHAARGKNTPRGSVPITVTGAGVEQQPQFIQAVRDFGPDHLPSPYLTRV